MTSVSCTDVSILKAKILTSPSKHGQDHKLYRAIELPNGLKALLVSFFEFISVSKFNLQLCFTSFQ